MEPRTSKRQPGMPTAEEALVQLCETLDYAIPVLRTLFLVAGLVAAACGMGQVVDYVFVTGLVFQTALWFEQRWDRQRSG